jgi:hypothetical protein
LTFALTIIAFDRYCKLQLYVYLINNVSSEALTAELMLPSSLPEEAELMLPSSLLEEAELMLPSNLPEEAELMLPSSLPEEVSTN